MEPIPTRILRLEPIAKEQSLLTLEHAPAIEALHDHPAQYCLVEAGEPATQGHFVLVDPPGAGQLRFLLRSGGPAADVLRRMHVGDTVRVRGPLGPGFPVEKAEGHDVLLVSAGAGIAAIRPLLLALPKLTSRQIWLYHGTRTMPYVPFTEDLRAAQDQGVEVVIAVSTSITGDSIGGRVQHAIERDQLPLQNAVAYVSGMEGMVDAMRRVLPTLGLPSERVYLNY